MEPPVIGGLVVAGMFVMIAIHVPIGVAMAIAGLVGTGMIIGFEPAIALFGIEPSAAIASQELAIIALFLLMGNFAAAAGLSGDLYRLAQAFLGHRKGGLAMATVATCAGFGAVCGSSLATTATMTRIALPEMEKRGYSRRLSTGSIAAGSTLGVIVPPSVLLVLYAILTEQFVTALFVAALGPALIAVLLYMFSVMAYVTVAPNAGPAAERVQWPERRQVLKKSWGVVALAIIVSGGIYSGIFTVNEAAAVGAAVAIAFTALRGRLSRSVFFENLKETAASTALIYLIIIGASIFSYAITLSHLPDIIVGSIEDLGLEPLMVILLLEAMYIVLGSIFDTVAAMVITLPFVFPLITGMGYDPIWWGVINVVVMEMGMITPPIGLNVFVMHGMAKDIPLSTVYAGIWPFLISDIVRLLILTLFPVLTLWLPKAMGLM
ncbi:MAG: TRAP transporter large permease subunit [Alphaproteobacteria bacterium]|nr:TRAP transporter large permease subunit [Alphaproteobacteria bacterium]